jgi:hypothetical protein
MNRIEQGHATPASQTEDLKYQELGIEWEVYIPEVTPSARLLVRVYHPERAMRFHSVPSSIFC